MLAIFNLGDRAYLIYVTSLSKVQHQPTANSALTGNFKFD